MIKITKIAILLIAAACLNACKKDPPSVLPVGKEIEFETVYNFNITSCCWTNLYYDNTVTVINNKEEFERYIHCHGTSAYCDFTKYTVLVASGTTEYGASGVTVKRLLKISENNFVLEVEIPINLDRTHSTTEQWQVAVLPGKLNDDVKVELKVITTQVSTDLVNTKWKLVSIMNAETNSVEHYASNEILSETLWFDNYNGFSIYDEKIEESGIYIIDNKKNFQIVCINKSGMGIANNESYCYNSPFYKKQFHSFSLKETELKLFFTENEIEYYYLYKPAKIVNMANTKWKLDYIRTWAINGEKIMLEPYDSEDCYTLFFDTDTTAYGMSITNSVKLDIKKNSFAYHLGNTNNIRIFITPNGNEEFDGNIYCNALSQHWCAYNFGNGLGQGSSDIFVIQIHHKFSEYTGTDYNFFYFFYKMINDEND